MQHTSQRPRSRRRLLEPLRAAVLLALCLCASGSPAGVAQSQEEALPPQTVLPPGLFLFQTRTRNGTCGDAERTGYVRSAVATLDGVPGSRTMTMKLVGSKWWPVWTITVAADDTLIGSANMFGAKDDKKGSSRFEARAKKDRYQGVGSREYNGKRDGKPARCILYYDALLKPMG